jgi:hypothetical protein
MLVFLAACSGSNTPACPGAPATTTLSEGYCTANEADRCYYNPKPADGF